MIPNTFTMTTNWCEPEYVEQTDGGFVESFACSSSTASLAAAGPGEWERSFNRISARITGAGKVLLAVPWPDAADLAKRYPKAQARDYDGDPGRITEADALIAYLQVLGTLVDFKLYNDKANVR